MSTTNIKDAEGKLLGSVETSPDGTQRVRNAEGQLLGSYDPNHEVTKNDIGTLIAKGNALTGLLLGRRK